MLILKYFLLVGAVLTAGLIALSAYLGPPRPTGALSASSASLPTAAPKVEPEPTAEPSPPPPQAAAPARRSNRSARGHRRSQ